MKGGDAYEEHILKSPDDAATSPGLKYKLKKDGKFSTVFDLTGANAAFFVCAIIYNKIQTKKIMEKTMNVKYFFFLILLGLFSGLYPQQTVIDTLVLSDFATPDYDHGLYTYDLDNNSYWTYQGNYSVPLRPDLRIGQRNNIFYRGFFRFSLLSIPADATVLKVLFESETVLSYPPGSQYNVNLIENDPSCIDVSGDCYHNFNALHHIYEASGYHFYEFNGTDPIIQSVQQGMTTPPYKLELKIELIDDSQNNFEVELKPIRLAVVYEREISPQTYDVTVENSFQGGHLKVDSATVLSGAIFTWQENSQHTMEALDQDWPSPNNYFRVFQNWDGPSITGDTNKTVALAISENAIYEAVFLKRFDFDLTTDFIEGSSGGALEVDGYPVPDPYHTTLIEGSNKIVQVLPTTKFINGKNINYNFTVWSDDDLVNPRTFTPDDHTNATAVYKGHLASISSDATGFNNQRKMVYDGSTYHMAYESNGEIWYTTTSGSDNAWTNEVRLSDGDGGNSYPSIDIVGQIPVVVWQQDLPTSRTILLRQKSGGSWQNIEIVNTFMTAQQNFLSIPVVITASSSAFIVWHNFDNNNLSIRSYNISSQSFNHAVTAIPNTNSSSNNASLTADRFGKLHLAWEESGNIYYSKINYSLPGINYTYSPNKEAVSNGTGYSNHVSPSITTDYDTRPNVVWQAYSGPALETQIILHRRRAVGSGAKTGWATATAFIGNEEYFKPSIAGSPGILPASQELQAVWVRGTNLIWTAEYDGTAWTNFYQGENGVDPTISANISANQAAKMVYRSSGTAPYVLTTSSNNLAKRTNSEKIASRRGVLSLRNSEIAFELGQFKIDSLNVDLQPYSDTSLVGSQQQFSEMFRTASFQLQNQATLSYARSFEVLQRDSLANILPVGAKIKFLMELVDANTDEVLGTPDEQEITRNVPLNSRIRKQLTLRTAHSREVYLRVSLVLPTGLQIDPSLVEVNYEEAISAPKVQSDDVEIADILPDKFELFNNYPNPFNPSTTISFATTEDQFVTLKIYDIQGRLIKTLLSAYTTGGKHSLEWNGRDEFGNEVASGMYLYRIQAGKQHQVRKMLLLR